jgi:hypothetical protein
MANIKDQNVALQKTGFKPLPLCIRSLNAIIIEIVVGEYGYLAKNHKSRFAEFEGNFVKCIIGFNVATTPSTCTPEEQLQHRVPYAVSRRTCPCLTDMDYRLNYMPNISQGHVESVPRLNVLKIISSWVGNSGAKYQEP